MDPDHEEHVRVSRRFRRRQSLLVASACAGLAFALGVISYLEIRAILLPERGLRAEPAREAQLADDLEALFATAAEQVRLSVVAIGAVEDPGAAMDEEAEIFGGLSQESIGSGFIIDTRGYVLTNHHMVAEAREITVKLHDGREVKARVIKGDVSSDIALIKIEAEGLTPLPMGDSKRLRVGQWVLAVGNPFGLTQTVSAGIVSALGRSDLRILPFESFIQTDASINPGNSGGPLVNLRGEAVGINTAMYSNPGGGNQGIGFAIPIDLAKALAERWIEGKSESFLGVYPARVDLEMAKYFRLEKPRGAFLTQVNPGGPAALAGLKVKDLVLAFGGTEVQDDNHLRVLIASARPDEPIDVEVQRQDRRETLKVVPREKSRPSFAEAGPPQVSGESLKTRLLGITVTTVNTQTVQQLGLVPGSKGLAIIDVQPGSPASKKGLRLGDVIVELNDKPVARLDELKEILERADDVVMLGVIRESSELSFVFLGR